MSDVAPFDEVRVAGTVLEELDSDTVLVEVSDPERGGATIETLPMPKRLLEVVRRHRPGVEEEGL